MIPYDDLVAALQAWRARQGLPVATPAAGPGVGSGPARPGTPPPFAAARPAPPTPPPRASAPQPVQVEAEADHETLHEHEIEEHAMIEESHYENEGDDFAMSFGQDGHNGHVSGVDGADGSETMVGHDPAHDPERPSDLVDPGQAQRNGRDDW